MYSQSGLTARWLATAILLVGCTKAMPAADGGRLPMLSNNEAWQKLPGATAEAQLLPSWARVLAGPMPKTTAAMLELDAHHRTGDRLPEKLRGKLRWVAADANKCEYARTVAASDLRRAGLTDTDLAGLAAGKTDGDDERDALTFARKMMVDANTVTDADVKHLIVRYGEKPFVGMVTLLAHAAFQDRMLLALNVPAEAKSPPPVTAKFTRRRTPAGPPPPPQPGFKPVLPDVAKPVILDPVWQNKSFTDLQQGMSGQKERVSRIRIPDWTEVGPKLPADSWGHRLPLVFWNRVAYAHQPEASDLWFDTVDQFRQESKMDRVLAQYVFWVVTRANDCFY